MKISNILLSFLLLLALGLFSLTKISPIFTLSDSEVEASLLNIENNCDTISDCGLLPGDILLRRYSTNRTRLFENYARPYFTHSALYYGNGLVAEAIGNDPDDTKEIVIRNISETDWTSDRIETWIIIRPKIPEEKIRLICDRTKNIANDDSYTFGIKQQGNKRYTCSSLIFDQLIDQNIINKNDVPEIITPDFIFRYASTHKELFNIVGFKKQ
ncbi:MAG: hypothetical protein WCX74_02955 [Candidatus Paceibacterota bacterium]